mmetsp:Transcript_15642/g.38387  ORF Transcript_15642/g.38387 Transcript_15642/m.38387 type:complete len:368 (-) Transcript_15642:1079-2182(-)
MSPFTPRRGVVLSSMSRRTPSLVTIGCSKFAVARPWRASSNSPFTRTRHSGMTKSAAKFPITSSVVYPRSSTDFWFHAVTFPSMSIAQIGAFAASRIKRVSEACRADSLSALLRSVTSWPTPTIPVIAPFASRRGVALSSTSTRPPSFVKSGNSNDDVSCPCSASSRTPFTAPRYSGLTNTSTRSRPIASSLLYPTICAALRFHSLTLPPLSMPKIGAFAVSMSRRRSRTTRYKSPSAFFRSVIFCTYPVMPEILPWPSRRGMALRSTSMRSWSLVKSGNSKADVSCPCSALSSTRFTCTRFSGRMSSSTKSRPITSSLLNPTTSAALRFHSLTRPDRSMPKTGAFAESSITRRYESSSATFRSVVS